MKKYVNSILVGKRKFQGASMTVATAFILPVLACAGGGDDKLPKLPPPIATAVAEVSPGFILGEAVFREDKGYYKIEGKDASGNDIELRISPDGTVIKHEVNGVEIVGENHTIDLPAAVQSALESASPSLSVRESGFDELNNVYKIEGTDANGGEVELLIAPDGTVVKHEIDGVHVVGENHTVDLPAVVQSALESASPGLSVRESRFDELNDVYK
ncbi:MAG: hypothetical protein KDN22_26690, partial [Verrucomicrobiae bacterium]|nr:hypothetical protein [Verrucomicrobiae bacterium]